MKNTLKNNAMIEEAIASAELAESGEAGVSRKSSGREKILEEFDEKFKYQDDLDQDEDIKLFLQAKIKKAWIDGFMETGEGYNGEYCSGHGGNDVTREEVAKIYDETLSII